MDYAVTESATPNPVLPWIWVLRALSGLALATLT